jgi:hypothetical protein
LLHALLPTLLYPGAGRAYYLLFTYSYLNQYPESRYMTRPFDNLCKQPVKKVTLQDPVLSCRSEQPRTVGAVGRAQGVQYR